MYQRPDAVFIALTHNSTAGRHAHQDASAQMLKGVDLPDGKATTALPMPQSHRGLHRIVER